MKRLLINHLMMGLAVLWLTGCATTKNAEDVSPRGAMDQATAKEICANPLGDNASSSNIITALLACSLLHENERKKILQAITTRGASGAGDKIKLARLYAMTNEEKSLHTAMTLLKEEINDPNALSSARQLAEVLHHCATNQQQLITKINELVNNITEPARATAPR